MLKSWAVAKGPSYFPGDKRLAVQVEDHPIEYGGFEGIIPKGQYGGGTVMLWDRGTWEPAVDVDEGLRKGSLKFTLHGEKMRGKWALIRMAGRAAREDKPNWLLIKEHDAKERPADARPITEEALKSVLSGRDMDEIASDHDRVWQSNRNGGEAAKQSMEDKGRRPVKAATQSDAKAGGPVPDLKQTLKKAKREKLPEFIPPQLAVLGDKPPSGDHWIHELKLDGYRIQIRIDHAHSSVKALTRTGLDWTNRMRAIAEAAERLPVKSAVIDGELVVLSEDGNTSFAALQAAFQGESHAALTYFAFDLLHLDGYNLRDLPLVDRKEMLAKVLGSNAGTLRLSEHIEGDSEKIFRHACELGSEGIVSKTSDGAYVSGRTKSWIKSKCYQEQEFVIGGFTLPSNGTHGIGALLLGYYRDGELIYAGRTGTGFTQATHRSLRDRLDKLRRKSNPFHGVPADGKRGAQWTDPDLVAQVSFSNWTNDNLVRQASFKGLREDKSAKTVNREDAVRRQPERQQAKSTTGPASVSRASASKSAQTAGLGAPAVRLTHPDKVLDSESGVTKRILAAYYEAVAHAMFPHIADRPLTLVRCPEGSGKPCFYQKHNNKMIGGAFSTVDVIDKKTNKPEPYITISNPSAIAELAQIGVLEVHPWGSHNDSLETPDRITFDLDPDDAISWETLAASAMEIRKRLSKLKLKSFVKSTGGKGLHVVVPIKPEHAWAAVKEFAHSFVLGLEKDHSSLFLTKMTKAARKGKIYLDYLRNERGSTAVAPYSPRARAGLPVAIPLKWVELAEARAPRFTVGEFTEWKSRLIHDPWKELPKLNQHLSI